MIKSLLIIVIVACVFAQPPPQGPQAAICVFTPTANFQNTKGTIFFDWDPMLNVTNITGQISGLAANAFRGFHIHEKGDMSTPDASGSGLHYNPFGQSHGGLNSTVRHAGDLGNLRTDAFGNVTISLSSDLVFLSGPNSVIGRVLIIHNGQDDLVSSPTGNSGTRAGHCVIGIRNVGNNTANNPQSGNATCELRGTQSNQIYGRVNFLQNPDGTTTVTASVCNIFINGVTDTLRRGFHVHTYGDLSDQTGFLSTGLHYDPFLGQHSSLSDPNRHAGDLGNVTVLLNGNGTLFAVSNNTQLFGLNSIIGRSIVFHSSFDDGFSQPTGNSGSRLASCTVGWVDTLPTFPLFCPQPLNFTFQQGPGLIWTPNVAYVPVGTLVTWRGSVTHNVQQVINATSNIPVVGGFGGAVGQLPYSQLFTTNGTFHFVCTPHAAAGMRGVLYVGQTPPVPTPSPRPSTIPGQSPRPGVSPRPSNRIISSSIRGYFSFILAVILVLLN